MPLLQGGLTPTSEEIEQATKVARRLLGIPKQGEGTYSRIWAAEDLWPGEVVNIDSDFHAKRWDGTGIVSGMVVGPIRKGCFGWIKLKS